MLRQARLRHAMRWVTHRLKQGNTQKSLVGFAVASGAIFATIDWSQKNHPISQWLAWDYLALWVYQLIFCLGCLSSGNLVVSKLPGLELRGIERLVVSMGSGVIVFVLGMYLGGALGWFSSTFALGLVAVMIIAGGPSAREVPATSPRSMPSLPMSSSIGLVAWIFGIVSASLLYLQAATPESIAYDAAWSHLTVAEDYAREGRIVPFITNTPKNLPHLASLLYTWSFLLPGLGHPALHWMGAQHTELLLFLWTLVGVAAAVRWALPERAVPGAWAAVFLFPGIYVYDSNLGAAADHVAAFFAIPFLLVSARASESFRPGPVLLSGALAGALLHTKFQCLYLVAPVAIWFVGRWSWLTYLSVRSKDDTEESAVQLRRMLVAPLLHIGAALFVFGPHLLTNWVFYKNPLYPLMLEAFDSRPYISGYPLDPMTQATSGLGLVERFQKAFLLSFSFSFDPQYTFIGRVPVFGSLFTFLSPLALLFWRERRALGLLVLGQGAVFCWAFVYPIDRNLQLILPWLASYTAVALLLAWKWGTLVRIGLSLLVVLQIAWGAKFMIAGGEARVQALVSLFKADIGDSAKDKRYDRFRSNYLAVAKAVPEDAVLLLHTHHGHLGMQRRTLVDWAGWQYAIDYRTMKTPRDVYERYRELGVTHIVWNNRDFPAMKQEDALFFAFSRKYAKPSSVPGFTIWEMPQVAPPDEEPLEVGALGLHGYKDGLYDVEEMGVIEESGAWTKTGFPAPKKALGKISFKNLVARSDVLFLTPVFELSPQRRGQLRRCFDRQHRYYGGYQVPHYEVYLRRNACPRQRDALEE